MILLVESCLCQHHDATVQDVHRCIANYLKLAPYRVGGAGRGCHAGTFESTLVRGAADNSHVNHTVDGDEGDVSHDGDDEIEDDDDHSDEGDAGDAEGDSDVEDN